MVDAVRGGKSRDCRVALDQVETVTGSMAGEHRPLVSVVTISRDDLPGLKTTLASVRGQEYPRIEHVVIDGGSGEHVETYLRTQTSLTYWQSSHDDGRYDAMNQGRAHSHGDLVWFLHSSDAFATPMAVSQAVDALAQSGGSPRHTWGYGRVNKRGENRSLLGVWGYVPFDLRGFAFGSRPIPHQAAFFGADLLDKVGPYDLTFGLAADQLLMLSCALTADPVTTENVLCDFDTSGAGSVRPLKEHYADVRRSWDLLDFYPGRIRSISICQSRIIEWNARVRLGIHRIAARLGITL